MVTGLLVALYISMAFNAWSFGVWLHGSMFSYDDFDNRLVCLGLILLFGLSWPLMVVFMVATALWDTHVNNKLMGK